MKKIFEKYKIIIFIIIIIFTLICINLLVLNKKIKLIINILVLLCSFILYFINKKNNIKNIINDFKSEIKNITWIDKKELNQTILTILLILSISIFILWIIDSILTYLISKII